MIESKVARRREARVEGILDCAWTLAHLARSPDFVWTAERASDWRQPWADYTLTRYGAKAEREDRRAAYLRFMKIG